MITKRLEILFSDMPFRGRKYLSRLDCFHPLIRGQLFYSQSISPYKLSRLNCKYRYLQLLLSQCIYPNHIFTCIYQEIKPKGGEPLTLTGKNPNTGKISNAFQVGEVILLALVRVKGICLTLKIMNRNGNVFQTPLIQESEGKWKGEAHPYLFFS
jgi:hypothetical protein